MDRIILSYKPGTIVFYAGENDIAGVLLSEKKSPEQVFQAFTDFCAKVHKQLPDTRIYFTSIKPPKRRIQYWPKMQEANALVEDYCKQSELLDYIDISHGLMTDSGDIRTELFRKDGIHLNPRGYKVLTSIIKPVLDQQKP